MDCALKYKLKCSARQCDYC